MKGLHLDILSSTRDGGEHPLNKLNNATGLTLIIPGNKSVEIFEPDENFPAVSIETVKFGEHVFYHLVPCDENGIALPGCFMMGGTFGFSYDSRFPFDNPVAIHDRQEN